MHPYLSAFYLVGIPFAFASTLKLHLGLYGTWIGLSLAEALIAISYTIITITSNWKALSKQAQETAKG